MNKLDELFSKLEEVKEELSKGTDASKANLNNPYGDAPKGSKAKDERNDKNADEPELKAPDKGLKERKQPSIEKCGEKLTLHKNGQWELEKGSVDPKLAPKDVKVKELQAKIDAGQYKPDAGKIADKMLSHPEKPLKKDEGPENPHMGHSVFTMDHIKAVSGMKDHKAAKAHAHAAVDASNAQPHNKKKAKAMIDSSKNSNHLAIGMSNFLLAHPSENLKVGR